MDTQSQEQEQVASQLDKVLVQQQGAEPSVRILALTQLWTIPAAERGISYWSARAGCCIKHHLEVCGEKLDNKGYSAQAAQVLGQSHDTDGSCCCR